MLYYFPHPSNMRLQREVIALRRQEGAQGYGIYVMILELMRDSEGQEVYDDPDTIAFALHEDDVSLISRICHDYSLFRLTDDGYLISPFLQFCQEQADERKSKAREWGKAGAKARYSRADQPQSSPSDAQKPQDPGPQPTPEHREVTYRVPIPPPIGSPCIEPKETKETERKETTNQTTKSKLVNLEWLGLSGSDWLNAAKGSRLMTEQEIKALLNRAYDRAHNGHILDDWLRKYNMSPELWQLLASITKNWEIESPEFQAVWSVIKHVRDTKYNPQHPSEYLISTAIKFYNHQI